MTLNRKNLIPLMMVVLLIASISGSALIASAQDTNSGQDVAACGADDTDNVEHEAEGEEDDANEQQCPEDDTEEADSTDCAVADTDDVQEEVEDNSDDDTINEESDTEDADTENEADDVEESDCGENDALQEPAYTASIAVDDSVIYASEQDETSALASLATISADEAQAIVEAETGATVAKVELDNENGYVVYSVQLDDGSDVKVDAGNGAILIAEPAESASD